MNISKIILKKKAEKEHLLTDPMRPVSYQNDTEALLGGVHGTIPTLDGQQHRANSEYGTASSKLNTRAVGLLAALSLCTLALVASLAGPSTPPPSVALVGSDPDDKRCDAPNFRSTTLKAVKDDTYMSLFHDLKQQKKFEASDVIIYKDHYYSICDSNWAICKVGPEP